MRHAYAVAQAVRSDVLAVVTKGAFAVGCVGMAASSLPVADSWQNALASSVVPAFVLGGVTGLDGFVTHLRNVKQTLSSIKDSDDCSGRGQA